MRTAVTSPRTSHTLAPSHDEWSISISSSLLSWPENAPVSSSGDLDWANPKTYVPEFAAAAEKLQKGQMTDTPVHTQFGWHIIRVDDIRDIQPPPLDQVKGQIVQQMQQEKLQAFEQSLRAKAKIQ